jgi:CheY-like chemotaxis protein
MLKINNSSSQLNNHAQIAMQFSDTEDYKQMGLPAKILVVEDDLISQRVVKIALESNGYQVDVAETGKKALAHFKANDYMAILMDMGLPDIKGTEVTRQIREFEQSRGSHTPIIALTAHGTAVKNECLAAGMDDFTTKPIELDSFNLLIKRWIEKLK